MACFRAQRNWRCFALAALIAAHFAAAVAAVLTTVEFLGLQELQIVVPVVAGLLWGQAILLGTFLLLGTRHPLCRALLTASWYAVVFYLGRPFFRATAGKDAFQACCVLLGAPLVFSALLAAARRGGGVRVKLYDAQWRRGDNEALQFSLRRLFSLTLLAAVALAGVRLARDIATETSLALLFGLLPGVEVFVLLPLLSLWAALGDKDAALRSAALVLLGLASVVGPLFIGRAKLQTYWMLVCPVVVPSLVVLGSLLIVRVIGYRYVVELSGPFRRATPNGALREIWHHLLKGFSRWWRASRRCRW